MREDIGVVVQLKAPDLSIVQFTQSASDARVGETFDVEHSEIDRTFYPPLYSQYSGVPPIS